MTQNNEWKELCKSIIILRARDEWWNGSDDPITLSDIEGFDKIESFILSEKQKSRDEVIKEIERGLQEEWDMRGAQNVESASHINGYNQSLSEIKTLLINIKNK